MVYVSPAVGEMLSQKSNELEGKDFFDLVFGKSSFVCHLPVQLLTNM
jgi:hypothetical protein